MDRATGGPSENPTSFADMRNIVYFPGAVRLRPGLGASVATLGDPVVCSVGVFQAYGLLVWVIFDPVTLDVNVVQTNLQGQSETAVGTFGVLDPSAQNPPRFTFAESYGILVIAHDEPNVAYRFDTYRFDPADTGNEWDTIEADLDGTGAAAVQFRGVVTHLGAVWGWGYGSASDPDRPEVLRRSDPADPTVYVAEQYIQFGARLDPIIGCAPVQSSLAVFKGSSWYRLDGNTAATYSPQLVDPVIGLVSAQSVQNIQGTLYWWSPYGPRSTTGGATIDISGPLDLTGPLPADLPPLGPPIYGFTYYSPDNQKLGFAFPDPDGAEGTVAYCLSLQGPLRWSLDQIGRTVLCAVLASTGQTSIAIDPGYADNVTVDGAQGDSVASATIGWTNEECVGDEVVEIWGSMNSGPWTLLTTVPVNLVTSPQTVVVSGGILASGTLDVAIRHRRLGRYRSDYVDSSDPSLWPADSQGSGTIVAIAIPTGVTCTYDFADGSVDATWVNGDPVLDIDVALEGPNAGTGTHSVIAAEPPATTAHVFAHSATSPQEYARLRGLNPLNVQKDAGNIVSRLYAPTVRVRVRHRVGAILGGWSAWSTVVAITYDAAPDGVDYDNTGQRQSVALGTGVTGEVVLPSSRVGDVRVWVASVGTSYGVSPANSGCGAAAVGPGAGAPGSPNVVVYSTTATLAASSPLNLGFVALPSCGTCLSVGQGVRLGAFWVTFGWTKAGDFAEHGTALVAWLPSSLNGPLLVCGV